MEENTKRSVQGFTLIEILVTTAIIGLLIGIVLGISGIASRKSDESKARTEMQKIANALEEYRLVYNSLPTNLNALTSPATAISAELKELKLIDPWGRDYVYTTQSRFSYSLMSGGPKGSAVEYDNIVSGTY